MTRVCIFLFVFALTGCASISDFRFRYSTERKARLAWQANKLNVNPTDRTADFADGFKSGFVDVSRGGDGACPVVPPPCYWDARIQTPEGNVRLERWYAGFSLGATAAFQCGTNQYNSVPSRLCTTSSCPQ